jgi:hypothetical protein
MAKQTREDDALMTPSAVGLELGISPQTVVWLDRIGRMEAIKTTTGQRLFRASIVQAELERRQEWRKRKEMKKRKKWKGRQPRVLGDSEIDGLQHKESTLLILLY